MTALRDRAGSGGRARRFALAALVCAVALHALSCQRPDRPRALTEAPETPFVAAPEACPAGVDPLAGARADEERGRALMQRHPFDPADGVRAVGFMERAAHCLRRAGALAEADRLVAESEAWRADVDREYRAHLVRMRRALEQDRAPEALVSVRALRRLLVDGDGAFVRSLEGLERKLAVAPSARKQKKEKR
jgi:hypothetical protein